MEISISNSDHLIFLIVIISYNSIAINAPDNVDIFIVLSFLSKCMYVEYWEPVIRVSRAGGRKSGRFVRGLQWL